MTGGTTEGEERVVDGRTARAIRTRDSLVEATMALVEEGDLRPTAPRIAERAGVSVRSVFQHFDDLESLFSLLGDRTFARVSEMVEPIDAGLPLEIRVERFVDQRCRINEAVSPINRAAMAHLARSETIAKQFELGHRLASGRVAQVFAPEIATEGIDAGALLDGVRVATAWSTWNLLRNMERRSIDDAALAVRRMVDVVLIGAGALPRPSGDGAGPPREDQR